MRQSLIKGLSEKDMQAVLNTYNVREFVYPTLFPFKFTPTLTWKSLSGNMGAPVAADVVAYDATAPRKTRKIVERAQGDIPKIEISRVKGELELNEYFQLQHYANTTEGARALIDFIYDDMEFCWDGVNARLEWLAMTALSTGQVALAKTTNAGIVTETAVDFLVPAAQKTKMSAANRKWDTAATAKPITDIKAIVKLGKAKGIRLTHMFMNQDTFDHMVACTETINFAASWVLRATNLSRNPALPDINAALRQENLPEIVVIDSLVTIEQDNGTQTAVNPWSAGKVTFTPSLNVGYTYHAPLADELVGGSAALKVKRNHVLIKKFSVEEPTAEITKALANAFPVWNDSSKSWIVDTLDNV